GWLDSPRPEPNVPHSQNEVESTTRIPTSDVAPLAPQATSPGLFESVVQIAKDDQGRLLVIDVIEQSKRYRIVNLYGPNSEGERRLDERKCRGAMIRSKAQHMLKGERCTAFFLGLEKRKQSKTYISEIKDSEGNTHTDSVDILQTVQDFYSSLFSRQEISQIKLNQVLGKISCSL
ncbi:hypothetical protein Q8A73_024319, partial [Channa argus]